MKNNAVNLTSIIAKPPEPNEIIRHSLEQKEKWHVNWFQIFYDGGLKCRRYFGLSCENRKYHTYFYQNMGSMKVEITEKEAEEIINIWVNKSDYDLEEVKI